MRQAVGDTVLEILAGLVLLPLLIAGIVLLFKKSNRPCPGCRAMVSDDAARCRHCGFGFVADTDASQQTSADEGAWRSEQERAESSNDSDEEPESSPLGAVSCVLCGRSAPAGDCVMVPERGPLCSVCVDAIISAATPANPQP
jgi:hypothetical protein